MADSSTLNYANVATAAYRRRSLPRWLSYGLDAVTAITFCAALWLAFENFHFDSYFPLRLVRAHDVAPFQPNLVLNESDWRFLKYTVTSDARWIWIPELNQAQMDEMNARIADNERWNRFFYAVRPLAWLLLFGSMCGFFLGVSLLRHARHTKRPTRYLWFAITANTLILLNTTLFSDYFGIWSQFFNLFR